jgi:hypothetical protein
LQQDRSPEAAKDQAQGREGQSESPKGVHESRRFGLIIFVLSKTLKGSLFTRTKGVQAF